jgi:hypothetical protein
MYFIVPIADWDKNSRLWAKASGMAKGKRRQARHRRNEAICESDLPNKSKFLQVGAIRFD